ncbi:MAG: DUF3047 domain-containing protein [Desulfuromonadales bacterium]|nr:DUF3047 domain-containing protein [Desulfuromonadales bacterium]
MSRITTVTIIFIAAVALTFSSALSSESVLQIGKFSSEDHAGWKEQTVFGSKKTIYSFVLDNGRSVLQGKSVNAASALIYKTAIDTRTHPIIAWSWKIDHTLKKGNERNKYGHDFAARLYVVFKRGFFSRTRAIEYVWGNVMSKGETIPNPYSKNMIMIAVDSGNEMAGKWIIHKRNFAEDYRNAFGEDPPKVGAIAIMTDSDNTHETATGYYGDISILPDSKEDEQEFKEKIHKEHSNGNTT